MKREIKFPSSGYFIKISVELEEKKEGQEVLSIMGEVYKGGRLITGGQCYSIIDRITSQNENGHSQEWEKIKYWWGKLPSQGYASLNGKARRSIERGGL